MTRWRKRNSGSQIGVKLYFSEFSKKFVPGKSFIGVYARNCIEWDLTAIACYSYSMIVVPLYDTLGPEAASFIINQANIEIVICDDKEKVRKLLSNPSKIPSLKFIVLVNDCGALEEKTDEQPSFQSFAKNNNSKEDGVKILSFTEIGKEGSENPQPVVRPKADDMYIVCYTSGTTGKEDTDII